MPRNKRDVEKSLESKGFMKKNNDHRYYYYQTIDGKISAIFTKTSHSGKKEIGVSLLHQMAKQCKLDYQDFLDLIDCPLTQEKYNELLTTRGLL